MKSPIKYYLGIFLLSFSTLLYELSLTRVFSVTLWYHFGFLIISTALLGFGASGVILFLWKKLRVDSALDKSLTKLSIILSLSMIFSFWLLQKIPFDPFSLYADAMQFLYMPVTYVLVALPFFFSGLSLSLLFTRYSSNINRLYAFDLVGAALGCIAIVPAMKWFGGGGAVVIAAAFSLIGSILFAGYSYKKYSFMSVVLLVGLLLLSVNIEQYIPLRITSNKGKWMKKIKPVYTEWNSFSRIDLYIFPSMVDSLRKSPVFIFDQGTAATGLDFDLKPDVRSALKKYPGDTLYASTIAYISKRNPEVLVIGSGCGTQILDALHHGVKHVTGVEINPIINKVASDKFNDLWGNLFHQPEVSIVTDEGRNYVRSTKDKFDAIISTHTISNAAIASGALSLSENYVLTKEAFEDYYDHLKEDGVVYFTRPEFQIPRLFATVREVLTNKGVTDIGKHFFAFTYPEGGDRKSFQAIFMMSKKPFDSSTVNRMKDFILATKDPSNTALILYNPIQPIPNIYDSILHVKDLNELYKNYPFEISPATDNQPFFNHHTRWSAINAQSFSDIFTQQRNGRMALEDRPIAEVSLLILLFQVITLSALFILYPLFKFSKAKLNVKPAIPYLIYFSGLGCGFIMIEIVFIQQFSLLLGEPVYTFAIVLAALLLFTGLGAAISGNLKWSAVKTIKIVVFLLSVLLLLASFFLVPILTKAIAFPMLGRLIVSLLIIFPFGFLLGIPFPTGIKILSEINTDYVPWAWGVNGFFTVVGTVITIILSMIIGFQAVIWIAITIYLLSYVILYRFTIGERNS